MWTSLLGVRLLHCCPTTCGTELLLPDDGRTATVTVEGQKYAATLLDLPCLVESYKTLDQVAFHKSNNVGQILLVHDVDEDPRSVLAAKCEKDRPYTLRTGLTPPTKDIARRRWRKPGTKKARLRCDGRCVLLRHSVVSVAYLVVAVRCCGCVAAVWWRTHR